MSLQAVGGGVGLIEIDRPEAHNALDQAAQHAFAEILARACADPAIGCLVLAGAGGRALSAGWDIKEMTALDDDASLRLALEREEWLWRWYTCPLPTVAAVQGIAYGVGSYLVACADLRVGGPSTRFKVTGMSYGYASLSWLLADLVGTSRAKDVLFTARVVDGQEAAGIGLLNRFVSDERIRGTAIELAAQVAALPGDGVREAKRLMREGPGRDLRSRYDAENLLARQGLEGRPATELFSGFTGREKASG